MLAFDAKTVIQRAPLKLIDSLTFDETSAKNWKKTLNESLVKNYMKSLISLIMCHNVFFNLFLTFHEASAKNWKKSLMAFQCKDWDTKFSYQIDYFWLFMKLQQKTWRNIYLHFNAKTVIQHFLLTLILFLTFHDESVKNLVVICTGCTKLQEAIYVISMQSDQIFYSLHGFCSWFFMNP